MTPHCNSLASPALQYQDLSVSFRRLPRMFSLYLTTQTAILPPTPQSAACMMPVCFRFWRKSRRDSVSVDTPQPEPALGEFKYSLKTLFEPENAVVDVIFVHGLTGHQDRTWTAENAKRPWPEEMLPTRLPQARIMTFGYDAGIVNWRSLVSKNRIGNHAQNLVAALSERREDIPDTNRPIIFVAHSLGGLVVQDALLWSHLSAEKHIHKILDCTRGTLFLGTPHSGSGFAPAAVALAKWVGVLKQTNPDILQVLKTDSEVLARIQAGFLGLVRSRESNPNQSISITCFYEELPLIGVGKVVPLNSAIIPGYTPIGIHSNHMDMARFTKEDDPGYVSVSGELWRLVKNLTDTQAASKPCVSDQNAFSAPDKLDDLHIVRTRPSSTVTHNGNNAGEARVVYGGTMTNTG